MAEAEHRCPQRERVAKVDVARAHDAIEAEVGRPDRNPHSAETCREGDIERQVGADAKQWARWISKSRACSHFGPDHG
jgi:hypothetical protein